MQRGGQCAILKNEIRAAPRAVTLAKVFRTQCRMKKEVKTIRAAKCYFGAGTARLSEARISKTHPRKGTETLFLLSKDKNPSISKTHPRKGTETFSKPSSILVKLEHFKNTSPQGGGARVCAIKKQGSSTKVFLRAAPLFSCSPGR